MDTTLELQTLEKVKAGDLRSLDLVITAYEKQIFNHLYRITGNYDDALDLSQDTFLKLYKNRKKINLEKNFKSWLYRIATNTAFDWLRKKVKRQELFILSEENGSETISEEISYYNIEGDLKDLESALERIKPIYRTIILLYYRQGFSYQEMAEIMNMPINTIKTHISRAKFELKKQIDEREPKQN